jgi:uncharacterized protein YhdP
VDAWDSALDALGGDPAQAVDAGYLPRTLNLRADELRFGGHRLAAVVAQLRRQGEGSDASWQAEVRAEQLEGLIEYRPARGVAVPGLVKARLRRASVAGADPTADVHELLVRVPSSVPALDVVIDDFELRGKKLGRLQIDAVNRMPAVRDGAREWQLDRLELTAPEAVLAANGRWQVGGRMRLDFKLDLADSGAFAERLGAGRPLRGGKGQVSGQLSWAGSPLSLDYPSLDGQLAIALDKGQFLHADPGGARLLGVLSLQALPRRLTLDFRDLFQEGFAFDSVLGDVAVARGVASTRNLAMRGAQATVLMQGSADLRRETQDLQVLVVPNFDATGAALATFAINPAIGLGALFAQWALREPMIAASTREYRISGSWGDPQVTSVQRTADSPRPSIDPAPPPAPAPPTARNQPSG